MVTTTPQTTKVEFWLRKITLNHWCWSREFRLGTRYTDFVFFSLLYKVQGSVYGMTVQSPVYRLTLKLAKRE